MYRAVVRSWGPRRWQVRKFALGMQGEKSFGGSGAPANLCQIGYQPSDRFRKQSIPAREKAIPR